MSSSFNMCSFKLTVNLPIGGQNVRLSPPILEI